MTVIQLGLIERAELDTWRLIGASRPDDDWDADLDMALEQTAEALSRISLAWSERDIDALAGNLDMLSDHASALGLNRIARVASTAFDLCDDLSAPALGANVARLMRLGRTLFEDVWHLRDQG